MRLKRAALAAEFQCLAGDDSDENDGETAQILDRKYVIKHLRVDTTKMKAAMKAVLSNPLMTSDKLQEVSRSIMDSDLSLHSDVISSSSSEKENAQHELETSDTVNINKNEIDILEISRAVLAPPDEDPQTLTDTGAAVPSTVTASIEMACFAAEVRQKDFVVEGTHTFTSLFTCLPHRMNRRHVREVTVANSLVIALHMCNENSLQLLQERPHSQLSGRSEPWMMDFTFSNGRAPSPPDTV
uniref:Condensin complex subunit 2 n=1 Tax=Heterorhabditis bacteriophora TaxID=37862 RepID=A0A1I7XII7_HETBA